ncbi:MAG: oligosaccharide flippase family protein [Flavobacteriaceae bacterium]|nr:oligosaccharide flippase family protein [Flavobacteriaceae bacterium]
MDKQKPLSRKIQVLFLSIGRFLTTISVLISTIFLSRILNIEQYASYRQTLLVFSFLAPLLSLGFDRSIYYNFEKNKNNHAAQILNIQYVTLSIAFIFTLFFIFGGAGFISLLFHNPNIEKGIIIYSIFSILNLPILLLQPVLVLKQKVKLLTIFNVLNKLLSVIVIVLVAYYYKNVNSILIAILFFGIITFVVVEILLIKNTSKLTEFKFNKKIINDYKSVGLPLLLASIMGIAGKNIDKFLISVMMTPADLAVYANGAIEIPLIGAITGAIMVVILVDFTKLLNQGKIKETFALWNKAVETTASILIPIMFILLLNADWLIVTMFGEAYAKSALPFKIYLLLIPMRTMIFSSLITASGKTKNITKGALVFILSNLILSLLLIKTIGFIGPAIATIISTYLSGVYLAYSIKRNQNISFYKVFAIPKIYKFLLIGATSYFISIITLKILNYNLIINIAIYNTLFIVIFAIGIFLIKKVYIYKSIIFIFIKKKGNQ